MPTTQARRPSRQVTKLPLFVALMLLPMIATVVARAQTETAAGSGASAPSSNSGQTVYTAQVVPTIDGNFKSAIVIDADTGWVLVEKEPSLRRQPASMLKMMTELIGLERVATGDISMSDTVIVSAKASRMGGSQVYLKHGERFSVEELLSALAIQSANDAAVSLAEHIAGSTEAFVDLMNDRAKELGLRDTEFHSVHGLPAGRGQRPDLTTARDMAVLGRALIDYPEARAWASSKTAPFRGGKFLMYNPNKLVGQYRGLDGIKTGYHGQAGFCVTASAVQMDKRLISVVMGAPSDRARATETTRLLSYGFNLYTKVTVIAEAGQQLAEAVKIDGGKSSEVMVAYAAPLTVSVPKNRVDEVVLQPNLPEKIPAPFEAGDEVGQATAMLDGHPLGSVPIVATESVEKGNWFDRLFH